MMVYELRMIAPGEVADSSAVLASSALFGSWQDAAAAAQEVLDDFARMSDEVLFERLDWKLHENDAAREWHASACDDEYLFRIAWIEVRGGLPMVGDERIGLYK